MNAHDPGRLSDREVCVSVRRDGSRDHVRHLCVDREPDFIPDRGSHGGLDRNVEAATSPAQVRRRTPNGILFRWRSKSQRRHILFLSMRRFLDAMSRAAATPSPP
jgi:hypothetical protein